MDGNELLVLGIAALVGYGFGAINPASIIAKAKGIDLADVGSGNPGATNAARAMGKNLGIVIGILDVLKGLIPALLFARNSVGAAEVAGFAAVVGHVTSPFLRGRGGKGVATTLGAVLGAQPLWVPFVLGGFVIGFLATKRVGIGAVLGAVVLFVAAILTPELSTTLFGVGLAVLVLVRHRQNILEAWHDRGDRRAGREDSGRDDPAPRGQGTDPSGQGVNPREEDTDPDGQIADNGGEDVDAGGADSDRGRPDAETGEEESGS